MDHGHTGWRRYTQDQFEYWFWRCIRADARLRAEQIESTMFGASGIWNKESAGLVQELAEKIREMAAPAPDPETRQGRIGDKIHAAFSQLVAMNG